jgi:hypothetical protein
MKIKNLLAVLENLNPDFDLTIWVDGERFPLDGIDTSFFELGFIELNAKTTEHEATK